MDSIKDSEIDIKQSQRIFGFVNEAHPGDRVFQLVLRALGFVVIFLFLLLFYFLFSSAYEAMAKFGFQFISSTTWSPSTESYGTGAFIFGTIASSFIALSIAVPVAIGAAVFITELCPQSLRTPFRFLIEMLAAIPSVVYGLWGIFVLAPVIRTQFQPFLATSFPSIALFQGPPYGVGLFTAGLVLSIMILPTMCSICVEVFGAVPALFREGAKALGATEWETIKTAVLRPGLPGIVAATIVGVGRAFGETMAVAMVIGNRADISSSLFAPAATMSSVIANEYAEAGSPLHLSSLMGVGLVLLFVTLVINVISRIIIWKVQFKTH